jgi:small subunit ribosomal protein S3
MGQKTHPIGFRLGVVKDWTSRWYAERDFPRLLNEDETIRKYLRRRLSHAALALVEIERKPSKIVVTLHTARPGVVIGKRGAEVDKLRDELGVLTNAEISVVLRSPGPRGTTRGVCRCTHSGQTLTTHRFPRTRPTVSSA